MKKLLFIALLFIAADTMAQSRKYKKSKWTNQQSQNNNGNNGNHYGNKKYQSGMGNFYSATTIVTDYHYTSPNGQYFYTFQPDGNLVVYRSSNNQSLWSSGTQGRATKALFQKDGNLVLSDVNGAVVWDAFSLAKREGKGVAEGAVESAAQHRTRGSRNAIMMQDDGNLVIYAGNGTTPRWFTGTNQ